MKKDLISIADLTKKEIKTIIDTARFIKIKKRRSFTPLKGKTLGMIFEKPSTRTRVSFEAGFYQLGGYALFLSSKELQLRRGETIKDTARTLSRYLDGIVIRAYRHTDVIELAKYSSIPVINGLTDLVHPCQVLSDLFTISEKKRNISSLKIVYIGDGNNIANSWINASSKLGLHLVLCLPKEHNPDEEILVKALRLSKKTKARIELVSSPKKAVKDADIIYTDVWVSMGEEKRRKKKEKVFMPYQVNNNLIRTAKKDVLVMHCLPAHRGKEITDDVIDGPHSIVFDQAENRLHIQKAILYLLMLRNK